MSITDPISDMLARIRNAIIGRKTLLSLPSSNMKAKLAEILRDEGYIRHFEVRPDGKQGILEIELKYDRNNKCAIEGMQRVSKPGQRVYTSAAEVPKVRNGLGIAVVTTSMGLMTDRQARKSNIGGEVVCAIW
jgi:small subunit ribosomal protein S8